MEAYCQMAEGHTHTQKFTVHVQSRERNRCVMLCCVLVHGLMHLTASSREWCGGGLQSVRGSFAASIGAWGHRATFRAGKRAVVDHGPKILR